jgi:non-ribosomal peptide synthetase component F
MEQQLPMTGASMFWLDTLHDCNLDQSLPLPYDRYRLSDERRTGHGTSISFDFGEDLSHHFLTYALLNNIQPQDLALAIYYAFLFKLTHGERDLCIGMNTSGRYNVQLMSIIGMFVNAIPLRCQLDPLSSFHQLLDQIQEILTSSMKYSYFPLQRILNQHPNTSQPTFLDIFFEFQSSQTEDSKSNIKIGNARLCAVASSIQNNTDNVVNKFDFSLIIKHDLKTDQLSSTINASIDLFEKETVEKILQRFHSMLKQLFTSTDDHINKPTYALSLMTPEDEILIKSINNTSVLFSSVSCVHHEFVCQILKYPQKLAVELDDQSLSYSELLHYAQLLSLSLLNVQGVILGEMVCQCVDRSLSMVSLL